MCVCRVGFRGECLIRERTVVVQHDRKMMSTVSVSTLSVLSEGGVGKKRVGCRCDRYVTCGKRENKVLPGFEPGSLDSESRVLTITP